MSFLFELNRRTYREQVIRDIEEYEILQVPECVGWKFLKEIRRQVQLEQAVSTCNRSRVFSANRLNCLFLNAARSG